MNPTRPTPPPAPVPLDWEHTPTFCTRCETYMASSTRPVCVVCLDMEARGEES